MQLQHAHDFDRIQQFHTDDITSTGFSKTMAFPVMQSQQVNRLAETQQFSNDDISPITTAGFSNNYYRPISKKRFVLPNQQFAFPLMNQWAHHDNDSAATQQFSPPDGISGGFSKTMS